MKNIKLIDFDQISFIRFHLKNLLAIVIICFIAAIFVTWSSGSHSFLFTSFIITVISIIFITNISLIYRKWIYVYYIEKQENQYYIKYKANTKNCELKVDIKNLELKFVPYGRNNPYLKFSIKKDENTLVLKQFKIEDWQQKTMHELIEKHNSYK